MWIISTIAFLLLSFIAMQKGNYHFRLNEILKGFKFTILSITCLVVSIYSASEIKFEFPDIATWFMATVAVGKALPLPIRYIINIKRVEEEKKYFSSIRLNIGVLILVGGTFALTGAYNQFEAKSYLFLDALYYLLLGASLIQWLESKKKITQATNLQG